MDFPTFVACFVPFILIVLLMRIIDSKPAHIYVHSCANSHLCDGQSDCDNRHACGLKPDMGYVPISLHLHADGADDDDDDDTTEDEEMSDVENENGDVNDNNVDQKPKSE